MNIKNFISEIEKIKLWLEKEHKKLPNTYYEYLGFYPGINDELTFNTFSKGYWSTFIFSHGYKATFGLRILPKLLFSAWPIVRNVEGYTGTTFSNNLQTFIPFNQIIALLNKNIFQSVKADWEIIAVLNDPLLKFFDSEKQMDFIRDYAFNPANQPISNEQKDNLQNYLKFWYHYDTSHGHKVMRDLIDKLNADEQWLPDSMPEGDLGIWETRIKNMLMSRAKSKRVIFGNEKVMPFILEGFLQPHGYDAQGIIVSHTSPSKSSKSSISAIVGYFALVQDSLPKWFVESHFYQAAENIEIDFNAYVGKEHYLAALELIEENKPLEAWNALISASYWAGVNGRPDLVEKHWQKAIELCQNQNWEDALNALTYQWEWYQNYKKENNIS